MRHPLLVFLSASLTRQASPSSPGFHLFVVAYCEDFKPIAEVLGTYVVLEFSGNASFGLSLLKGTGEVELAEAEVVVIKRKWRGVEGRRVGFEVLVALMN